MSAIDHAWGESRLADRAYAQISGLRPSKVAGRLFCMLYQAFLDESFDRDTIVVGGYISTAKDWVLFSKEWDELLLGVPLGWDRRQIFKMSELAQSSHGKEFLFPAFYRVIEKYCKIAVSASLVERDIKAAKQRIFVPHQDFSIEKVAMDKLDNRYVMACAGLMAHMRINRSVISDIIPEEEVIDFYFDEKSDKVHIQNAWRAFIKDIPDQERRSYGNEPRFEIEDDFAPLQAGDAWAWWVREACARSLLNNGGAVEVDFDKVFEQAENGPKKLHFYLDEDMLTRIYMIQTRMSVHKNFPIIDRKNVCVTI